MHSHRHHHNGTAVRSMGVVFVLSIIINVMYVAVEAGMGIWSKSLGLVSDAGHNLGDVFSLALALIAFRLAGSHSSSRYTYGYRKASVLISLVNAILLLCTVGAIVIEAVGNLIHPSGTVLDGSVISITAGIGIAVNGLTTWMLSRGDQKDINARGAFLHMLADTLVSVGVVVSGIVIKYTGFYFIDPAVSLAIAFVILVTAWKLLAQSFRMSIDAVPDDIDLDEIRSVMSSVDGVLDVHHMHIWSISTTEVALTAHVVIDDLSKFHDIVAAIKSCLGDKGVQHSTIEIETPSFRCASPDDGTASWHDPLSLRGRAKT